MPEFFSASRRRSGVFMTAPSTPFADFAPSPAAPTALRRAITHACRRPEREIVPELAEAASLPAQTRAAAARTARALVEALRTKRKGSGVEELVQEFSLSSQEGVALMCLAEALLRVPDAATRDDLIRDKIAAGDWKSHLGGGRSLFVNAATWGLVITGRLTASVDDDQLSSALTCLVARCGEPVIRGAVDMAVRMMGEQFVTGQTIREALKRARRLEEKGFRYSYDMLGEAAATAEDAGRYHRNYAEAIHAIGAAAGGRGIHAGPGISIKLSALHPRYERGKIARVMDELLPRVTELALQAKSYDIGLNIDAEEANRLEISLDLLEALCLDPALAGWDGLGFAVQAYGKRCPAAIDFIADLARRAQRRIMVRLVKGAYWDTEIKRAQVDGLADFPVFTRKVHTDVSYIACARKLLAATDAVYPQFATHNAHTLATIYHMAGSDFRAGDYEFQCLHGMGEPLYEEVVGPDKLARPCRIYAPVGTHETLLAYLVRRLLENGANSSFVNRLADPKVKMDDLVADPVETVRAMAVPGAPHEAIALPRDLFGKERANSAGFDLADDGVLETLSAELRRSAGVAWRAAPVLVGGPAQGQPQPVRNPADRVDVVGEVVEASAEEALRAVDDAAAAAGQWAYIAAGERAAMLKRTADLMQARMMLLMGLVIREAGKSAANAVAEVREAIDFLRYYAGQARRTLGPAQQPIGPVICISPWNFPLAIFTGQVAAALAAGNPVIAKPANTTPLIAAEAVRLFHQAGVPVAALQFLPAPADVAGSAVAADGVAGVMFTGSTGVARTIQGQLAKRLSPDGRPVRLIAETGGQNAMIVDSSALAEQVVADVLTSAFDSAGQRCSALRVLYLQEDIAERMLAMLKGAMRELAVGRTDRLCNDIGPVITAEAKARIDRHISEMRGRGREVFQLERPGETARGTFVAPTLIELDSLSELREEIFGPVLHVLRYRRTEIDRTIDAINATGYGLTFGLHTRLDSTISRVTGRVKAGNLYVNRNTIGAVVGSQPFGGRGLSGTGPKAGGPLYLGRLVAEPPPTPWQGKGEADPALAALIRWLEETGESEAAWKAGVLAARSGIGFETELPGPVGERNLYRIHPRGRLLLLAQSRAGFLAQLCAAIATGNHVVADAAWDHRDSFATLPPAIAARIAWSRDWTADGPYGAALVEGDAAQVLAASEAIAALPGPLVIAHAAAPDAAADEPYPLEWLIEEQVVSTNTAAAGGNASLMAIG